MPVPLCVPRHRCLSSSGARLGAGSGRGSRCNEKSWSCCAWQEGSGGKGGGDSNVLGLTVSWPQAFQPQAVRELRRGSSCSLSSQTLIFIPCYGMEMFDFTALVYIAGK